MVKNTVRTSASIVRMSTRVHDYPANPILSTDGKNPSAWIGTSIARTVVRADTILGREREVRVYKGGFSSFFLTSNQSRLNSWGFKCCIYTSFFLTGSLGSWLEVHYRQWRRFFYFASFSTGCWFQRCQMKGLLWGIQRTNLSIYLGMISVEGNWKLEGSLHNVM
jgi:hypothetical protein